MTEHELQEVMNLLIGLEIDISAWKEFDRKLRQLPVHVVEIELIDVLKPGAPTEVCRRHLERKPTRLTIYSGTLHSNIFENEEVLEKFEVAINSHLKEIKLIAGPYIMNGPGNHFVKRLVNWICKENIKIKIYPATKRLPVHCMLSDTLFSYEGPHSEFTRKRHRYLVDFLDVIGDTSDGESLRRNVELLLESTQGILSSYVDRDGKDKIDRFRRYIVAPETEFKTHIGTGKGFSLEYMAELTSKLRTHREKINSVRAEADRKIA